MTSSPWMNRGIPEELMLLGSSRFTGSVTRCPPRVVTASPVARTFLVAFTSACSLCPQDLQQKTTWLSRFSSCPCPQAEQVGDVYLGFTSAATAPDALVLSSIRFLNKDQDWPRISRFSPLFWDTFLPGFSIVPLADLQPLADAHAVRSIPGYDNLVALPRLPLTPRMNPGACGLVSVKA